MRLIDADKLLEDLKQKRYSKRSLELIHDQHEVAAIPIEWIRDYIDYTFMPPGDYCVLQKMLKEWEKENEKTDEEHN